LRLTELLTFCEMARAHDPDAKPSALGAAAMEIFGSRVRGKTRSNLLEGITDTELELAKDQARSSVLLSLEDSASRAAALAQAEMTFGRQIPVEETLANIDAVTTDDAVALAREFFKTEAVAFAALGDLDGLKMDRDRLSL